VETANGKDEGASAIVFEQGLGNLNGQNTIHNQIVVNRGHARNVISDVLDDLPVIFPGQVPPQVDFAILNRNRKVVQV
jgi:hypothetical protein